MRRAGKGVAILAGVVALAWFGVDLVREVKLKDDFRADVIASDFTLAEVDWVNPSIEKEDGKTYVEIYVIVNGCTVELSRRQGDDTVAATRSGRQIERYELDEAIDSSGKEGDEKEIDGAPPSMLPAEVEDYLRSQGDRYNYCLAPAR